jgi:IclR family pca regulon transcriptional regulator
VAALNVGLAASAETMEDLAQRYLPALRRVKAELVQVLV